MTEIIQVCTSVKVISALFLAISLATSSSDISLYLGL